MDPLLRQRLAGEERRARVLAAAALGAGEGVEPVLPREVLRRAHAHAHRVGVAALAHDLLEIHGRHRVGGPAAPEVQRGQRRDDVEMLAGRQDHQEGEDDDELDPVGRVVARGQRRRRKAGQRAGHEPAGERVLALVRDAGIAAGEKGEPEAVEQQVRDHDRGDQRQHQQGFAVGLEPGRPRHVAPPVGIGQRRQHGELDGVLRRREGAAGEPRVHERLVVPDDDQLDLAHEQRHEAEKDHRVHDPGLPVAPDHPLLQEAVGQDRHESLAGMIEAILGRERGDDGELAPGEVAEPGECGQHQQRDGDGAHRRNGWRRATAAPGITSRCVAARCRHLQPRHRSSR